MPVMSKGTVTLEHWNQATFCWSAQRIQWPTWIWGKSA